MRSSDDRSKLFTRRPVLLLLLLVALCFWRYTASTQFTFLEHVDGAYQVLPWYQMQARAWHAGEFPLWDPYVRAGQPLLAQMQPGAAFPLNWLLFSAPLQRGVINLKFIHWQYVLAHILAALFMFALTRVLGVGHFGSVFAGLAFAATGYLAVASRRPNALGPPCLAGGCTMRRIPRPCGAKRTS